jgi:acetate kinase
MSAILAVNAGSSSLKFALFENAAPFELIARGEIAGLPARPHFHARGASGALANRACTGVSTTLDALEQVLSWIALQVPHVEIAAVGNRVVHGGTQFVAPVILHEPVMCALEQLDPLAPQHQPFNLAAARVLRERFPQALPVACFDTAFHATWPDAAQRLPLPRRWHEEGLRRYGFHGLSYEFLSERVRTLIPHARRVVFAHLGSGASICAVRDGRSIESTMGFSALDGLPMATRSGAIDPGVIFHLHRRYGMNFDEIESMLYRDSGLKGVSGGDGDMRELLASSASEAREAIDLFVHRCIAAIGAMVATLGGIDALVFSGGIGANSSQIRAAIGSQLACFGVRIAPSANRANDERISRPTSRVRVFALATDEEYVIARHCSALLGAHGRLGAPEVAAA